MQDRLVLGNLNAKRDWGYAPDYVEGMWRMLQQDKPEDIVLATGVQHTVRHFTELSFKYLDIDLVWEGEGVDEVGYDKKTGKLLVSVDSSYFRPTEVKELLGDASKAKRILGWKPKVEFEQLVESMVLSDLDNVKKLIS